MSSSAGLLGRAEAILLFTSERAASPHLMMAMAERGEEEGERDGGDQPALLSVKPIEKEQTSNDELLDLGEGDELEGEVKLELIPDFEYEDAFRILGVLSPGQCRELCRRSEAAGYTFWNAKAKKDFRSAFTVETVNADFADFLWNRIKVSYFISHACPYLLVFFCLCRTTWCRR